MSRVDPVPVHGLKRLRQEYLERNPGGDFKAFLQRWDALREAVHGDHKPVRFYGLTFGHGERVNGTHGHRTRETMSVAAGRETQAAGKASIPQDEAGRLDLLKRAGLADPGASSLAEALQDLELPFMFAGREQWVRNLQRAGDAQVEPWLRNVSMESPINDQNALNLLLGRARDAVASGRSLAADVSKWRELVPSWAPGVRDQLASEGIPFSVELLSSPEINLTDPSKPLFGAGARPSCLAGLGVNDAGESAFLRSLSAEELMTQVWPLAYQYYHRPAGAPVPEGFEAGLTFGSPAQRADGTFVRSPIMETDAYKRWAALGFPGDPTQNGVVGGAYGASYNPLLGTGDPGNGVGGLGRSIASGDLRPEHLYPFTSDWNANRDVVISSLGVIGAAAFLDDPSVYFAGPRADYNPANLDEATRARLTALLG
jgi:hypothetical protein